MKIQAIPMKAGWTCVRLLEEEADLQVKGLGQVLQRGDVPVHLCCIIDTSGSMRDDSKILHVKQSLQFFLDSMGAEDYLSIITFDIDVETLVQHVLCKENNKEDLRRKIQMIQAYGGTNLCEGLMAARDALLPFDTGRKQGIMLLTDGEATHGHVQTHAILDRVESTFEAFTGTSLSCIGYGTHHNVELLRRLSEKYAGSYYVVQQATDIPVVFGDIMGGLLSTRSQRIHIEVSGAEKVQSAYPVSRVLSHRDIYVGDLPSGKEAVVLIKAPVGSHLCVSYDPIGEESVHRVLVIPAYSASSNSADDEKLCAELHQIRYEVVELMSSVLDQVITPEKKVEYTNQIDGYKQRIQGLQIMYENPLWGLMLNELDYLRIYITEPARCCVDFKQVLIQRMGCLAMLRGVGASASNEYHPDVPEAVRLTPALSQGYSNELQHVYSLNYTQSSQAIDFSPPPPVVPVLGPSLPSLSAYAPGAASSSILLSSQAVDIDGMEQEEETQPGAI